MRIQKLHLDILRKTKEYKLANCSEKFTFSILIYKIMIIYFQFVFQKKDHMHNIKDPQEAQEFGEVIAQKFPELAIK